MQPNQQSLEPCCWEHAGKWESRESSGSWACFTAPAEQNFVKRSCLSVAAVSRGRAVCQGCWGREQSLGRGLLCYTLLQGNALSAEEHVRGTWSTPEQQLPADAFVPLSPSAEGKGQLGLAWLGGAAWMSLQIGGFSLALFPSVVVLQFLEKDASLQVSSLAVETTPILRSPR